MDHIKASINKTIERQNRVAENARDDAKREIASLIRRLQRTERALDNGHRFDHGADISLSYLNDNLAELTGALKTIELLGDILADEPNE